jgi:PAB-dependent poly(A)-specific ribonuclease subunit 3
MSFKINYRNDFSAMIFVYDYYPGSETLLSKYFSSDQPDPFAPDTSPRPYSHQKNNILRHQQNNKLPEFLIWNYIIQLTSALRLIHSSGKWIDFFSVKICLSRGFCK